MRASLKLTLLLPLLLCGCTPRFGTANFDRNVLRERLKDDSIQMPDSTIAAARDLKPQLRFPCRIAVYLQPESGDWRWTQEDKAAMEVWANALKKEGIASDVFTLPQILTARSDKGDLKELRVAAAKCGADALFVVHAATQTASYKNFAAVFNLTLVGGYVVPGSHKDSLFVLEGVLLDVDNGYIYTGVQAEGVGKIMRPTFVIEDKDAIAKAKAKALAQFGDDFLKRMRALKSMPESDRVGRVIVEGSAPAGDRVISSQPAFVKPAPTLPSDVPVIKPTPLDAGGVMLGPIAPQPLP